MPFASERLTCSYPESGVEMAAVCDVYEPTLEKGLKAASTGAKAHDNYKRVIDAERRTMRVVQVGMQRRSFDLFSGGPKVDGPARRRAPRQFLVAEQPAIPLSQSACR